MSEENVTVDLTIKIRVVHPATAKKDEKSIVFTWDGRESQVNVDVSAMKGLAEIRVERSDLVRALRWFEAGEVGRE